MVKATPEIYLDVLLESAGLIQNLTEECDAIEITPNTNVWEHHKKWRAEVEAVMDMYQEVAEDPFVAKVHELLISVCNKLGDRLELIIEVQKK